MFASTVGRVKENIWNGGYWMKAALLGHCYAKHFSLHSVDPKLNSWVLTLRGVGCAGGSIIGAYNAELTLTNSFPILPIRQI
ncbi:unnamed protein product, partial [Dovyalis caffra]